MSLSDKAIYGRTFAGQKLFGNNMNSNYCYKNKDVKEFIKKLKKEYDKLFGGDTPQQVLFRKKIDKLAGEKLV